MMEYWNIGILGLDFIALKNIMIALGSCDEFHSCDESCKSAEGGIKLQPTLIQTLKLCVFDHHSSIPSFQYSSIPVFHVGGIHAVPLKDTCFQYIIEIPRR